MTPSFVAVLPAIAPDLARRCLESMDVRIRRRTLVVDNTLDASIRPIVPKPIGMVLGCNANYGVAESWNLGIAATQDNDGDYLIIVSQSIAFGPEEGTDFLRELARRRPPVLMHSQHGWHLLAIARTTLDLVGPFDTVFPHYGNDTDYLYRMHLAGLPSPRENGRELDQVNVDASCEPDGETMRRGLVTINYQDHLDVYARKWGGPQGAETFLLPYNDERRSLQSIGPPC